MNIENVRARFMTLTGIDSEEMFRWQALTEDAVDYVQQRCAVREPDEAQTKRLEALAAAYALKLYALCGDDGLTQFVAGDVHLTSSADKRMRAGELWAELAAQNADLIGTEGFLFGRVIT